MSEHNKYKQGPEYFQGYGKRIIQAVAGSGIAYATLRTAANMFQLKYDVGNTSQYFHELNRALQSGSVSPTEAIGLAPMTLCCLVPIGILGLVLNRASKKKQP